jgi:hypothetical protein
MSHPDDTVFLGRLFRGVGKSHGRTAFPPGWEKPALASALAPPLEVADGVRSGIVVQDFVRGLGNTITTTLYSWVGFSAGLGKATAERLFRMVGKSHLPPNSVLPGWPGTPPHKQLMGCRRFAHS